MWRLSSRWVNWALLVATLALLASGIILLTTDRKQDAWVYQAHRYAGMLLLALLIPKTRIIFKALARQYRRGTWYRPATLVSVGLSALLFVTLLFVLTWTVDLLPFYPYLILRVTPLAVHWYVSLALVPLFAWHVVKQWRGIAPRKPLLPARPGGLLRSRREVLRLFGLAAAGLASFAALDAASALTKWTRRFTGSRMMDSFQSSDFPVTSSEQQPDIDLTAWRLRVTGRVTRPFELTYTELLAMASTARSETVDCTLGWASTQIWQGAGIAKLLERAGVDSGAREILCRTTSGYSTTLSMEEARDSLVATHVGNQVLSGDHGFPARLVAPTRRGYNWVKWMNEIQVS